MIPSPLQLEHYFFTRMALNAHPEADPEKGADFGADVKCAQHEDDPQRWMITLTVSLKAEEDDSPPPYTGEFEIVGMFRVVDDYPEDKIPKLAHINGAAILYGTVREMVVNLTARGPFPPVMLPTTTFIDECSDGSKKAAHDKLGKSKKKKGAING